MDHRLRVHQDVQTVEANGEQMIGFDQFKTLVHHSRRIDTDFRTHIPIGMRYGLRRRNMAHRVVGQAAKWPATCSQGDLAYMFQFATGEALKNGIMFAVHRQ